MESEKITGKVTEKTTKRKQKQIKYYLKSAMWFMIAIAVLLVGGGFLMRGKLIKEGENPETVMTDVMNCESGAVEYSFIETKYGEKGRDLKISMVFTEEELNVIGLYYDIEYEDEQMATDALQVTASELNIAMDRARVGGAFASNTKYTKNGTHLVVNLYASEADVTEENARFLLIDNYGEISKEDLRRNYEEKGFECIDRNE